MKNNFKKNGNMRVRFETPEERTEIIRILEEQRGFRIDEDLKRQTKIHDFLLTKGLRTPDYRLNLPEITDYFIPPIAELIADLNEGFLDPILVNVGGSTGALSVVLVSALPDDRPVLIVAVPDLRAVEFSAVPAEDLPGEDGLPGMRPATAAFHGFHLLIA